MKKCIILFIILFFVTSEKGFSYDAGKVDIHGFVSQGYLKSDKNNYLTNTEDGSFEFNEMAINFLTPVAEDLRLGVQFFARDLGSEGNDEVVLDWAYADYSFRDELGIRVGKVKFEFGLFNESRDLDFNRTSILLPQSIYIELWRDAQSSLKGTTFYGDIMAGKMGRFAYALQFGLPPFSKETGLAGAFESKFSDYNLTITDISSDLTTIAKLSWFTPIEGLMAQFTWDNIDGVELKGSMDHALIQSFDYRVKEWEGYIFSAKYENMKWCIMGEYYETSFKGEMDLGFGFEDRDPLPPIGWYISANYQLTSFFRFGVTYSSFYPDKDNKDGRARNSEDKFYNQLAGTAGQLKLENRYEAWLKSTTFSARFDLGYNWIVKLEATYNDGFGAYTSAKNPDGLNRYWMLYAAKMTFVF